MSKSPLGPGPITLDVLGLELDAEDRRRILDPLTGGVILVGRNFSNMKLIGISKRKWKKSYHSHLLWMEVLAKMYANFI